MPRIGPKMPPYSVVAEKVMLGAMLRDPALIDEVRALIRGDDVFFRPEHGKLFAAIVDAAPAADSGTLIEAVAAADEDPGEARARLRQLAEAAPPPAAALDAARTVAEKADLRRLVAAVSDVIHDVYYEDLPYAEVLRRAQGRLARLAEDQA